MTFTELPSILSDHPVPFTEQLRLAVDAYYLARFKDSSRYHAESDLRCYLALVRRTRPGSAGRAPSAPRAVHLVDAGGPPL
jgi:hypothetical protein